MPQFNLFKNCSYYWGFCAFMAYFINHPSYTSPYFGNFQVYLGLGTFILSELGNLSIHILLRNLRPEGSKVRKIPKPDGNPFTLLFNYVSCPNYSYEFYSWIGFTIMTQSLPSALFTVAGFIQMSIWALQKHLILLFLLNFKINIMKCSITCFWDNNLNNNYVEYINYTKW
uniref:EB domain-containing protein n=1 Tax=Strongyloides stercoralis TaxID=6248 RepID=A0AAF5I431_STRER